MNIIVLKPKEIDEMEHKINEEKMYTFFLEFDGGTFISQYKSTSLENAILQWSKKLSLSAIGARDIYKNSFLLDVKKEAVVNVVDVESVWCISPYIGKEIAIVHIIGTERQRD